MTFSKTTPRRIGGICLPVLIQTTTNTPGKNRIYGGDHLFAGSYRNLPEDSVKVSSFLRSSVELRARQEARTVRARNRGRF